MIQYEKKALKNEELFCSLLSIKMAEQTLKFYNIKVIKKEFDKSKQPIDLMSVNVNQIVVSD